MTQDSFTETTTQTWFERIRQSASAVIFGLILLVVAFPLLFWNEGRAVARAKALDEGAAAVIGISADVVDPANEGKLVHLTGFATTDETLHLAYSPSRCPSLQSQLHGSGTAHCSAYRYSWSGSGCR